jgi:hypothetical protein
MNEPILTARDALKEIRLMFGDGDSPGPDALMSQRMREAILCLRRQMPEDTIKISELEHEISVYLSAKKWQRRAPGGIEGGRQVVVSAEMICNWLESRLSSEDQSKKQP